ncbi:hypothetical protein H257_10901 [Aphanomyces astaci]|uniref:Uncharacterized protein n=1 Tax=Aphanomyces astaci TaxID=112090 RepID=W4G560_APHAT|nr:hypothetical protein H257_10901 [Aphanomyces astaci]ETV74862.1 hypothetical protein H257_10901 [Aphanomyces astaci]|eukprot:XP_009835949.1 hypothetical protein H257_10901 [Aphanomyces astaci]
MSKALDGIAQDDATEGDAHQLYKPPDAAHVQGARVAGYLKVHLHHVAVTVDSGGMGHWKPDTEHGRDDPRQEPTHDCVRRRVGSRDQDQNVAHNIYKPTDFAGREHQFIQLKVAQIERRDAPKGPILLEV